MAYICIRLQTNSEGEVSEELAAKIEKICPDIDLSSGWDFDQDEDEEGNITYSAVFGYGDDDFHDDEGNSLEGDEWDKENNYQWIEMLEYYIEFYPLSESNEIDFVWINDGSQSGYCPEIEYAQKELKSCEFAYRKDYIIGSLTSEIWELKTKTVRILQLPKGSKTVYF